MTRCNGGCSGRRAIHGKRTPAGRIVPSAGRGKDCSAAFVSVAGKSTRMRSLNFGDCPTIIQTKVKVHERQQTL